MLLSYFYLRSPFSFLPSSFKLLAVILLMLQGSAYAQYWVKPDRNQPVYAPGETVIFTVSNEDPANTNPLPNNLFFRLILDRQEGQPMSVQNSPHIIWASSQQGPVLVPASGIITYTFPNDGQGRVVICEIGVLGSVPTNCHQAVAVCNPASTYLHSGLPSSVEFQNFWQNVISSVPAGNTGVTGALLPGGDALFTFDIGNGVSINALIHTPSGTGPFNAIIKLPAAGEHAVNEYQQNAFIQEHAQETGSIWISLNAVTNISGTNITNPDPFDASKVDDRLLQATVPDYENPNAYRYKHSIAAVSKVINYLESLPASIFNKFTSKVMTYGQSQGGGLAILSAASDQRIDGVFASNPALCNHAGSIVGQPSGFPDYIAKAREIFWESPEYIESEIVKASGYFDAAFAASFVHVPAVIGVSYLDVTSPGTTTLLAANNFQGPVQIIEGYVWDHADNGQTGMFRDGALNFFNEVGGHPNLPGAGGSYYSIYAGTDISMKVPANTMVPLTLSGETKKNGVGMVTAVEWVSKPSIAFSPGNLEYQTTGYFSAPGKYLVKFSNTGNSLTNDNPLTTDAYCHLVNPVNDAVHLEDEVVVTLCSTFKVQFMSTNFSGIGGTLQGSVNTNIFADWSANVIYNSSSWLSITPVIGTGGTTVTVAALPNNSQCYRVGKIEFKGCGETVVIQFVQAPGIPSPLPCWPKEDASELRSPDLNTPPVERSTTVTEMYVLPNPAAAFLSVHLSSQTTIESHLVIYDLFGRVLNRLPVVLKEGENLMNVETGSLPSGVYYIGLETGGIRRFIKE